MLKEHEWNTDQNAQEINNLFSFQEFVVPVVH